MGSVERESSLPCLKNLDVIAIGSSLDTRGTNLRGAFSFACYSSISDLVSSAHFENPNAICFCRDRCAGVAAISFPAPGAMMPLSQEHLHQGSPLSL